MTIRILALFFLFFISLNAQSQQQIGEWKSFTDMKSVRSAVQVDGSIWSATSGGVFSFDTSSGTFTKFTNTDGLDTNDINAIGYDGVHRIWTGGAGGWVNIYDLNLQRWQTIQDIAIKTEYTNRTIQSFYFQGDTVFIVTEFGVAVFKISRWEFGDTYSNLGSLSSPHISCMTLQQNRIWIGTNVGIATASLSAPNAWTSFVSTDGIPSNGITTLAVFHDTVMIGTDNGLAYYAGGVFSIISSFSGKNIRDIRVNQGRLLILSATGSAFTIEALGSVVDNTQPVTSNVNVQGECLVPASSLWITTTKGLAHETSSGWNYIYPNGPQSNSFSSLIVDENSVLWGASIEGAQAGFFRYNPTLSYRDQWKIFTSDLYPIMQRKGAQFDDYHQVSLGANGAVWISSWGEGLVKVVADTIQKKYNYYTSPSLPGANTGPSLFDYVVGGGVAVDNEGKEWFVFRNEGGNKSLLRLDNDTVGTFFSTQSGIGTGRFHGIVIDQNNTKWMMSTVPWHMDQSSGLYFFNENNEVSGTQSSGGWGCISNMSSSIVLSLALGLDGEIWAGLGLGVVIIPDPLYPASRTISYPLREQIVQAIAVDALNHKWIGTKEGVFVMNADGTELLKTYNVQTTNKGLLANDIRAIALDQKRGIAYFGTEQGLSSLAIEPVQTEKSFSKLDVGPNPFILPYDEGKMGLTIRNLIAPSSIKIMTVSGQVIKQFEAQGAGQAFWDGRDKNGDFVASGIYFIVAYVENGSQTVVGKVAVIRHSR
jgi:ligand-binding sensor domain-containing protein